MKILHIDCSAGISGDMTLAALLDLGVPADYLLERLSLLPIDGYTVQITEKTNRGIHGRYVKVLLEEPEISEDVEFFDDIIVRDRPGAAHHRHDHDETHHHGHEHEHEHGHGHGHGHEHRHDHDHEHDHEHDHMHDHDQDHQHEHIYMHDHDHEQGHDHTHSHVHQHAHHHRNWSDIKNLIETSALSTAEKEYALAIFIEVAKAEAAVHNKPIAEVAFHEVGAVDSIVDIVGIAICLAWLKPDMVTSTPVSVGKGFVRCQHGILPVPAPATAGILAACQAVMRVGPVEGELTTPTGAAVLAGLQAEFRDMPVVKLLKIGTGCGTKDFGIPNVMRLFWGERIQDETITDVEKLTDSSAKKVVVIEAQMDDMSGETAGYVMERLLSSGALDVYYTPVQMKKNRPGVLLTVLAKPGQEKQLEEIILLETTSIGLRRTYADRTVMDRKLVEVVIPEGPVTIKVCTWQGFEKAAPEYETLKKLAVASGKPLAALHSAAMAKYDAILAANLVFPDAIE